MRIGRVWDLFEDGARKLARRKGRPIPRERILWTVPTYRHQPIVGTLNYDQMERVREEWRQNPQNG